MRKTITINPKEFSILHELLMEACYRDQVQEAAAWPETRLYGHNLKAEKDEEKIKESIKGLADLSMDTRPLRNAVKQYPGRLKRISARLIEECLAFLKFSTLDEMTVAYMTRHQLQGYEAPPVLKYSPGIPSATRALGYSQPGDKLAGLEGTQWWSYSHIPPPVKGGESRIMRLALKIHGRQPNGNYEIELIQKKPFTTFKGHIIRQYSTDSVLACELTSVGKTTKKRLYMFINIDLDASKDLWVGCFLRHTDNGSIYAGSFVMEREKKEIPESGLMPVRFSVEKSSADEMKDAIRQFLYDRRLNVLKLPRNIFSEDDLKQFLESKANDKRSPKYDLFLASPIQSFLEQSNHVQAVRNDLLTELTPLVGSEPDASDSLVAKVDAILDKHLSASVFLEKGGFEKARRETMNMIERLKKKGIGFNEVWYAPAEDNFTLGGGSHAGKQLFKQMAQFQLSRSFMMIMPFPCPMVSSVFLEAAWAMMSERNIPVFLFYRRLQDLPSLLRKADTLKTRDIFMATLDETGGIEGIPDFLVRSGVHL